MTLKRFRNLKLGMRLTPVILAFDKHQEFKVICSYIGSKEIKKKKKDKINLKIWWQVDKNQAEETDFSQDNYTMV